MGRRDRGERGHAGMRAECARRWEVGRGGEGEWRSGGEEGEEGEGHMRCGDGQGLGECVCVIRGRQRQGEARRMVGGWLEADDEAK